jgi:Ser/Thr protein kinase RdoA (MazF antagonist)
MTAPAPEPLAVLAEFALPGRPLGAERYGNGHINDTYLVRCDQAGAVGRYLLQRLNAHVFPNPGLVMANIQAALNHLAATDPDGDPRRRLSLVPAHDGKGWVVDEQGSYWRVYPFIENTRTVEQVSRPSEAAATARAFARFQRQLASYRGAPLGEVIPDFHHTPKRLARLAAAAKADAHGRLAEVKAEVAWALGQERLACRVVDALADGGVPARIAHNDTKINNVLFVADRDEGVCVIDLDTLMPGSSLYDFGDLVRTATATAAEDETDLAKVDSDPDFYRALADGWLSELGGTLTPAERELMPVGGALMTFETGVRFLTDWLEGDVYYKVKRPGHNRDRARNQLAMTRAVLRRHAPAAAG